MFCENCGSEIKDDSTFCQNCGSKIRTSVNASKVAADVKEDKNMIVALIISFILPGLGIFYAGNRKKGLIFFIVGLIFAFIGRAVPICGAIGILIWAYALYETYNEVKIANGEANPNLIEDIKGFPQDKKIGAIVVIAIIFLIVVGGIAGAFMPKQTTTTNDLDDDYSTNVGNVSSSSSGGSSDYSSSGSDSNSYSSSDGSSSYSSSSNGHDVSSHYEGEYGTSDTHGTVYDDGSVEAHETGHTDYGDYKIDSYMDSDGNIHGDVEVGGQTYHVSS